MKLTTIAFAGLCAAAPLHPSPSSPALPSATGSYRGPRHLPTPAHHHGPNKNFPLLGIDNALAPNVAAERRSEQSSVLVSGAPALPTSEYSAILAALSTIADASPSPASTSPPTPASPPTAIETVVTITKTPSTSTPTHVYHGPHFGPQTTDAQGYLHYQEFVPASDMSMYRDIANDPEFTGLRARDRPIPTMPPSLSRSGHGNGGELQGGSARPTWTAVDRYDTHLPVLGPAGNPHGKVFERAVFEPPVVVDEGNVEIDHYNAHLPVLGPAGNPNGKIFERADAEPTAVADEGVIDHYNAHLPVLGPAGNPHGKVFERADAKPTAAADAGVIDHYNAHLPVPGLDAGRHGKIVERAVAKPSAVADEGNVEVDHYDAHMPVQIMDVRSGELAGRGAEASGSGHPGFGAQGPVSADSALSSRLKIPAAEMEQLMKSPLSHVTNVEGVTSSSSGGKAGKRSHSVEMPGSDVLGSSGKKTGEKIPDPDGDGEPGIMHATYCDAKGKCEDQLIDVAFEKAQAMREGEEGVGHSFSNVHERDRISRKKHRFMRHGSDREDGQ